jgi:hypothetical protein
MGASDVIELFVIVFWFNPPNPVRDSRETKSRPSLRIGS